MFFKRSSKKKKSTKKEQAQTKAKQGPRLREGGNDPNVRQGLVYMYAIIGSQLLLLLIIMFVLMFMGKVITTPWWVFVIILAVAFGGCAFAYYRIKRSVRGIKKTIKDLKKARQAALEAKDSKMATIYKRRISRLKKKSRKAA